MRSDSVLSGAIRSSIIPGMFGFQQRRRRRIIAAPPPPGWEETLRPAVALYRAQGAADRARLGGQARVFLAEKAFEGCSGLAVTEEMKMVIAVQACLLILRRPGDYYPRLSSILLYPEPFVAPLSWAGEDGTVHEEEEERDGESWREGAVVLAWDEVRRDSRDGGRNIVLHEFAHQLDEAGHAEAPGEHRVLCKDGQHGVAEKYADGLHHIIHPQAPPLSGGRPP